jgi:starch phosphorylase
MSLAVELVCGVDLWLNTPRRPWEASGTSGMKVLVNGGLNLSELDGWWAEAYSETTGWALGDGAEHGADPDWDAREAQQLYSLLEKEVLPAFYQRNEHGVPTRWTAKMRESMASLTPRFSTNRMVRQYVEQYYLPAAEDSRTRSADNARLAEELCGWETALNTHWSGIHFGEVCVERAGDRYDFAVQIYLNDIAPDAVQVQLYAESKHNGEPLIVPMKQGDALTGSVSGYTYHANVAADRPKEHFTARIVPHHQHAHIPLEINHILWQH